MTNGRIDYSPDYKSEKRKPLNPRVKISPGGRPYVETKDLVDSVLRRIRGTSDPDRETERARLERNVIDLAKKTRAKGVSRSCSSEDCKAYYAAVDALIEFEAQEQ